MSVVAQPSKQPGRPPAAVPPYPVWRLTVDEYHQMLQAGIVTEDHPVELLEGWLMPKMPQNPPHRIATREVRKALEAVTPPGWYVDSQVPITTDDSEPEPDGMVVRGDTSDYADRHPGPPHVALVVEVADTTLQEDRQLKQRLYARAGIPAYWIVNLQDNRVEVYTDPSGSQGIPEYRQRQDYGPDDVVPLVFDGQEVARIPVRELLP
jgi:Uma2 family endonuclease